MATSKMLAETAPIVNANSSNPAGVVAAITAPAISPFPMAAIRATGVAAISGASKAAPAMMLANAPREVPFTKPISMPAI
jgi:hypothetical protein